MGCVLEYFVGVGYMGCVLGHMGCTPGYMGMCVLGYMEYVCPGEYGVCPGVPGVHAAHGGRGVWVPGAQLSSPRAAGQASRVVLSPGGMGWDWLGMKNAGQERSMPAPPGCCAGRGACGPGQVRLKAPGAGVRAPPCLSIAHLFSRARDRGRGEDSSFCLWSLSFNPGLAARLLSTVKGPLMFLLCSNGGRAGAWGTRHFSRESPRPARAPWHLSPRVSPWLLLLCFVFNKKK